MEEKKQDTTGVEAQNERWDGLRNKGMRKGMKRQCNKQREGDKGDGERGRR